MKKLIIAAVLAIPAITCAQQYISGAGVVQLPDGRLAYPSQQREPGWYNGRYTGSNRYNPNDYHRPHHHPVVRENAIFGGIAAGIVGGIIAPQPKVVIIDKTREPFDEVTHSPSPVTQAATQPKLKPEPVPVEPAEPVYQETEEDAYVRLCMGYGFRRSKCLAIWNDENPIQQEKPEPTKRAQVKPKMKVDPVVEPLEEVEDGISQFIQSDRFSPPSELPRSHVTDITPIQDEFYETSEPTVGDLIDVDNAEYKAKRAEALKKPGVVVQRHVFH